jgi:hypothetical protein
MSVYRAQRDLWVSLDGQIFEIQFYTPESCILKKEINHKL